MCTKVEAEMSSPWKRRWGWCRCPRWWGRGWGNTPEADWSLAWGSHDLWKRKKKQHNSTQWALSIHPTGSQPVSSSTSCLWEDWLESDSSAETTVCVCVCVCVCMCVIRDIWFTFIQSLSLTLSHTLSHSLTLSHTLSHSKIWEEKVKKGLKIICPHVLRSPAKYATMPCAAGSVHSELHGQSFVVYRKWHHIPLIAACG